jgi:hypothetical protein
MSPLAGVAKGNKFARAVAARLGTEARVLNGPLDRGDLVHRTWTLEAKAAGRGKPLNLSGAMTEAKTEAANAGTPNRYAVIARRTGYPTDEALFVMPLWMAIEVIPDLAVADG